MRTRRTFLPCWKDAGRTTAGEKERRDMLSVVTDEAAPCELGMSLDELAREGARRMLAAALEAEVDADIACLAELTDEHGHRLVVRNGRARIARSPPARGRSRSSARAWTSGESTGD